MKKSLADFNLFYALFLPVVQYATRCHYRHVAVRGRENLPVGGNYILAPCHQNAMMDPLVVLMVVNKPVVFLARADIFRNPVARFFLTWLRISPVYRIRDGRDQLSRNADVFTTARQALEKGMPLCLMAEGTHNDKHQLLPLVKGMFRIAGDTQREIGDKPLYIVPVGLDYDDYECPYSSVAVNIGQPIDVRQYMPEYTENEPVALNHMRDDLTQALKDRIHQVESNEHYDAEYAYCHRDTQRVLHEMKLRNTVWGRFVVRQQISRHLVQEDENKKAILYAQGLDFAEVCRRRGVPMWFASKWPQHALWKLALWWFFMLIVLILTVFLCWDMLPLWLMCNPIVYLPTHLLAKAKVKDPQFRSSINYGIRFGSMLVYLIVLFIVAVCVSGLWKGLALMLLGALSAIITPRVYVLLRDIYYGCRWICRR